MISTRVVAFAIAVVLISGTLQGSRALSRQRSQLQQLQRDAVRLEAQLATLAHDHEGTTRELTLAERQLAELTGPDDSTLSDSERAQKAEIAGWLARVKRLKQLFDQRPEQRIPEMRLLTDDDWLRIGKRLEFDNEDSARKALADVRSAAKKHFASTLPNALVKFAKVSSGRPPATVMALAPYLDRPADAEFLSHLELTALEDGPNHWAVQESFAVDADNDSRYRCYANGGTSISSAPIAWIPNYQERSSRAYRDFSAANKGAVPAGMAQMLPYFNPPLDPAFTKRLLKAERDGWR